MTNSAWTEPVIVDENNPPKFPFNNIKLYYQGYSASIYKNAALYSCLFPIYDYYKIKFNSLYVASICTTITVSFIIQPFDYYKTVKMAGATNIKLLNFTRGFTLMVARSIPHFTITMLVTEKLKKIYNNLS